MLLTPNTLEVAYDDKDKKGLDDEGMHMKIIYPLDLVHHYKMDLLMKLYGRKKKICQENF